MSFEPASDEQADQAITRLVDGTLSEAERGAVEAWVAERPEVARQVANHRQVAHELSSAGPPPPQRLVTGVQQRYEARRGSRTAGPDRRAEARPGGWSAGLRERINAPAASLTAMRSWLVGGASAAVLAVVIAIAGGTAGPTIGGAAQLAFSAPTRPAPAIRSTRYLDVSYGGVTFPNYARLGAVATGQLVNKIGGRPALTVYYRLRGGARLSYTVISGHAVSLPAGARLVHFEGVPLRVYRTHNGLSVVTLVRFGRTCVLAAQTPRDVVLGLAAEPVLVQHA